jgi:exocyst complex protein 7
MWPFQIDVTFSGEACATIRETAGGLLKRISDTALGTFAEFEEAVEKDVSKHSVMDGTVHPLTSYVINYVKYLLE